MKKELLVAFLMVSLSLAGAACTKQALNPKIQGKVMEEHQDQRPIGTAKMLADESLVLTLRAETGTAVGHAEFQYAKDDLQYARILKHIGGLKPGEEKPVPPFPDK